jgi:hypothetical protein
MSDVVNLLDRPSLILSDLMISIVTGTELSNVIPFWILDFATEITRRVEEHVFQSRRILDWESLTVCGVC